MQLLLKSLRNIVASFFWLLALGLTQIGNWISGRGKDGT